MLEDDYLNTDRTFPIFPCSCPLYLDSHARVSELFNYKRGQMLTFIYLYLAIPAQALKAIEQAFIFITGAIGVTLLYLGQFYRL